MTLTARDGSADTDAAILDDAAFIIRARSKRPKSFGLKVLCRLLQSCADDIRREQRNAKIR